ncbi:nucleoside-diphosphate kinase [Thermoplasma volcanium GSS1]|uniref:Nucleoside diphosphate kinase n=1 Tax=Thermoplasma volcanium (strain ATCC 51530 / DSM 4299 / JCM 9571 / NBRC 15438 / GSS1) TaxID=273116 RepID=NDK_THEVO|nr:nucleoside-diphosphate kinase [Thermoplasma volcanium]Q97BK5.1 RecName: Full=Nucleoside diphosphate kinase; Short=NDK; Short=NDP kinase; AltName: Full=Nucleoside-2-P kinase [Thermoplasma volcanium GSS1]BAB59592.1 nucleoside-diphosphate kinase [Thermoplasma volcanium GSS1]
MDRTLVLLKPDAVKRRLVGKIIERFEEKGLKIVAMKFMQMTKDQAKTHYSVHQNKPFFNDLVNYITSGPIVAMILEGAHAIEIVRLMSGATDGSKAQPGTIRGDYSMGIEKNIIHASDSLEAYNHEMPIFFSDNEIIEWAYGDEVIY